jgi:hypothetical protein
MLLAKTGCLGKNGNGKVLGCFFPFEGGAKYEAISDRLLEQ